MFQFYLSKMKHLQPKFKSLERYQYTVAVKQPKKPQCKFENDDKICLPRKRCVPSTTVCHTLPKQNCAINVSIPAHKKSYDVINHQSSPLAKHTDTGKAPPSHLKFLPNEEHMSPSVKMAYRFLKFNAKAAVAGGSIYLTTKYGVWGNSNQSAELYGKANDAVAALMKDNSIQVGVVPDSREIISTCKHYWNKGVIVSIASLIALPSMICKWSGQLYGYAVNNLSPESKPNPNK